MASINSFETDMRKLRRRRKHKRAVKNLIIIASVVALVMLAYFTKDLWLSYFEGILERQSSVPDNAEFDSLGSYPIDISKKVNVDVDAMQNCWTLYSDTSINTCDSNGSVLHSVYLPYSNPVVETVSKRALIYDMGGYNFTVISKKNEIYKKKLTNQILFAEIGEKGNTAVVTSTDKYPSYLTVYDKSGTEIFRWADGNLITAVALDDSGNKCAVASVYALGGSLKTVVSILDLNKTDIVSKSVPIEVMALKLEYTKKDGIWVIGDRSLSVLDSSCELIYSYNYSYDISLFDADEDYCAITFEKSGSKETVLALFEASVDTAKEITYNEAIKHLSVNDSQIYLNTLSKFNVLNKAGQLISEADLDAEYISFAVYGDEALLVGYKNINKLNFKAGR